VIVATPDHIHAVIALAAIQRGKHVYVQKPMTHSVYKARALTEAARKHKVMTEMGNQGHSGDGVRLICEWMWDGEKMEVANDKGANAYVSREYRQEWTL
jgi:predicted dehydrogenase